MASLIGAGLAGCADAHVPEDGAVGVVDAVALCVPGRSIGCACDGAPGAMRCGADRTWQPCVCTMDDAGPSAPDASHDAAIVPDAWSAGPCDPDHCARVPGDCPPTAELFCPENALPYDGGVYVAVQASDGSASFLVSRILPSTSVDAVATPVGTLPLTFDPRGTLLAGGVTGVFAVGSSSPLWLPPCYGSDSLGWDAAGTLYYGCASPQTIRREGGVVIAEQAGLVAVLPSGRTVAALGGDLVLLGVDAAPVSRMPLLPTGGYLPPRITQSVVVGEHAFVVCRLGDRSGSLVLRVDGDTGRWHLLRTGPLSDQDVLVLSDGRVLTTMLDLSPPMHFVVIETAADGTTRTVWSGDTARPSPAEGMLLGPAGP